MEAAHDFLTELYDQLHDAPMQRKLRALAPMPAGVVFIQWPGMGEPEIRQHFRLMKELGFSCLKGLYVQPGTDERQVMHWALDEGIIPWWYDEAGFEAATPELLRQLGIDSATPVEQVREHPKFREHQLALMRRRIDDGGTAGGTPIGHEGPGDVPFSFDPLLDPGAVPHFLEWLKAAYETPAQLCAAWNFHHTLIPRAESPWETWEQVSAGLLETLRCGYGREYRRVRDVLRFKADVYLRGIRARSQRAQAADPHAPVRAGGEMGLFLPFAARATDMEGVADEMAASGSFYPSIHLAWHFEEVGFEVTRPVYMQASLAHDWFKGGWSATWESTGGPQQLSGGKAGFWPEASAETAGFTVDAGTITHLMLSYLAAGFKGFGFWCWNARTAGWEAGEYALLDRQNRVTPRAEQAGRIARAAQRYRDELWRAHKEPLVGVFTDFENDAMWAATSIGGRDHFKHVPMKARVGISRALINHNVPWEYVTGTDLRKGLADRYRVIYLPAVIALNVEWLKILAEFVDRGGQVVMDLPGAWYDEFGRLLDTSVGSPFEQLFGCTLRDLQYSSNVPRSLDGERLNGFVADIEPTHANVLATYDDGEPAITEAYVGDGYAVLLGYEASQYCYKPGNDGFERRLVHYAVGDWTASYYCKNAIVYRLSAPAADHYFLLNDDDAKRVVLETEQTYRVRIDAVTQDPLDLNAPIDLPAYGGRWVRCEK